MTVKDVRPYVEIVTKICGPCQKPIQNISPPPLEKVPIVMGIAIKRSTSTVYKTFLEFKWELVVDLL